MKRLQDALDRDQVLLDLQASDIESAIEKTIEQMVQRGIVQASVAEEVIESLLAREREAPTAIGHAAAIPHAYLEGLDEQIVLFVRLARPVNLGALDGIPTRYLFFLLGPPHSAAQHLDTLASVARLMSDEEFRFKLGEARSRNDLLEAFEEFLTRTSLPAPQEETTGGLTYTGKFAGGLRLDLARRLPHYLQDFRDGLHTKCMASTLFLFFACLAPSVTFGGVMAVATDGNIGAVEMILSTAIGGMIYALFSGHPLNILGGTGPMLVITTILYQMCEDFQVPFLPTYAWIGFWTAGFLLLLTVADTSCLMRFFTRFTNEIFSALISVIYIFEAVRSLIYIFEDLEVKQHHDTALLSLLLALGTFYIAMMLSRFRSSSYLRPRYREFLADFGPAIALAAMTGISIWLHEVYLNVLPAPDSFGTTSGRPWLVNPLDAPVWVRFAAAGPALLVTVLVFLDHNITARIVNSRDHRLKKGEAYHWDLGLVGMLVAFCSCFGLPWLVAATVRSLNHVRSLATVEEVVSKGGETRNKIMFVRENRLTGFSIHLLIGCSLFMLPLLKEVPMAVLYGLFLYMGIVSMSGNQFFERFSLWLKDPDLYPATHYIRRVPKHVIHAFTVLQAVCLGVLWIVKESSVGILFPVFIGILVPIRIMAGKFFNSEHLAALDAEGDPEQDETHWSV